MKSSDSNVAVAYIRMSSDRQEKSPAQQREQVLRLAAKRRLKVIRWYEDLGISGNDTQKRNGFRRMIADATNKRDFSVVLCWSQDRFGRFDSIEAGEWVAPLRRAGVRLITVAEGDIDWTDSAGRIIYTVQQEGKNADLLDRARNSTRGRCASAHRVGPLCGRSVPYGYDKLIFDECGREQKRVTLSERFKRPESWTARLVVAADVKAAKTVQWIFRTYAKGATIRKIALTLNEKGLPSPRGGKWSTHVVREMLHNPVYTGDQVWNRRHQGRYFGIVNGEVVAHSQVSPGKFNPKEEWIVVQRAHPPLVSHKLFQRVQRRLAKRRGRTFQHPGLGLTGLVKCGYCGYQMTTYPYRIKKHGRTFDYRRMTCNSVYHRGKTVCDHRLIDEPQLLTYVIARIRKDLLNERFEERLASQLRAGARKSHLNGEARRRKLVAQLATVESKVSRGADNLLSASPAHLPHVVQKLSELESQRSRIARELEELDNSSPHEIRRRVADASREATRLRNGLLATDPLLLHQTLKEIIREIRIWAAPGVRRKRVLTSIEKGLMIVRLPTGEDSLAEETITFIGAELAEISPPFGAGWSPVIVPPRRFSAPRSESDVAAFDTMHCDPPPNLV